MGLGVWLSVGTLAYICKALGSIPRTEKKKNKNKTSWVPVAHTYNPSYSGSKIRRIVVQSQPRQIVHKTPS
jgi:hypothetical protein